MKWDISQNSVERQHRAIQNESPVGYYTTTRTCTGMCKRRRSIGQFVGDSSVCIRCARRAS